ncbi:MAG: right-handed parallel beta-helix repeat-containing protein [Bacillota bacterium]|nr:right-handed parallel beta-helix repeat-containing protein [Bacillota bacterium]
MYKSRLKSVIWLVLFGLILAGCTGSSAPAYTIAGVKDGGEYNSAVTPVIKVSKGFSLVDLKLNNEAYQSGTPITQSGDYTLVIVAKDAKGELITGEISFTVEIKPQDQGPAKPQGLSVTSRGRSLWLSWEEQADAAGYKVYRGTQKAGGDRECLTEEPISAVDYKDEDVEEGKTYWYWVQAYDADERPSVLSDPVSSPPVTFAGEELLVPNQYGTIQAAIDASSDGDTIIVKPGTYLENLHLKGKNVTLRSENPLDPNVVASTIIDGQEAGAVIRVDNDETEVVISGFTIRNGTGVLVDGQHYGGGIYVLGAAVTISHNVITENGYGDLTGSGIFIDHRNSSDDPYRSSATIEYNIIRDNSGMTDGVRAWGGKYKIAHNTISNNIAPGVYLVGRGSIVEHNTITGNTPRDPSIAGGMYVNGAGHVVIHNTITKNTSSMGGGLLIMGSSCVIRDNTITENEATLVTSEDFVGGGGLYLWDSDNIVEDNTIQYNVSAGHGGGVYVVQTSSSKGIFQNNNIVGNTAGADGGGMYLYGFDPPYMEPPFVLVNNTFENNTAKGRGGAVFVGRSKTLTDEDGRELKKPDVRNNYQGNSPDNVYYE